MSDGLLLVDKPIGPTSFDVVAQVRRRLGTRRVGHAGTLNPMASGLLPILVGEGTKLVPHLQGLDKEYRATVRLGSATDTYDAEGQVVSVALPSLLAAIDGARVAQELRAFVGTVKQRPPAYSALKRDGKRLYELARAGEVVVADEREVRIDAITVEEMALPDVTLTIRCGKGTYVRSIAHDLGARLGVGGHLVALRRTRVGALEVARAVDVFADAALPELVSLADAIGHLPAVAIDDEIERRLRMGQQQALPDLGPPDGARRLLDGKGRLVAVAEAAGGRWTLGRVFAENVDLR